MDKYKNLYRWMLIPMLFMQFGIFRDYWGDFSENAWAVHVHYWTGTVWYLYLIIQPYYATHGQLATHRTNGIIGIFIAGGVCLTAFSMMHRDIATTERARAVPEQFGPFQPWFFFGVAAVEIVMIIAFGFAVIKSIIHRRQLENHAWWLVSTVFIIMMPALGRGVQNVHVALQSSKWPNVEIMPSLYISEGIILALLLLGAWRYQKLKHPATWLAVAVNVFNLFLEPIGRSVIVQEFLKATIKG
ncbi:MAG: hypothetical protein J7599_22035 [Niabella sp.]|nr:hypothetical protein [Niabella sp.]